MNAVRKKWREKMSDLLSNGLIILALIVALIVFQAFIRN